MERALSSALCWGGISAVVFFMFTVGAVFMAKGDGSVPRITDFIIWMNKFAVATMGLEWHGGVGVLQASAFWSCLIAVFVFLFSLIKMHLQDWMIN